MLKLGFQLTTNLNSLPIPVGSFHVYRSAIDSFWCAILSYEQGEAGFGNTIMLQNTLLSLWFYLGYRNTEKTIKNNFFNNRGYEEFPSWLFGWMKQEQRFRSKL